MGTVTGRTTRSSGTSAARSMRRRPGATRWSIKLCRALQQELKGHAAEGEAGRSTLARKVWKIVLDCDLTGADKLKDRARERRRMERKREKRQRRKERKRRGKSNRRDSSSDDSGSSTSSGTSSSSSGSSSSSSGISSRTRKKHTESTTRRAGNDIAGRKEGEIWRGTGSAANTEFTLLGGRRHFKSKRSGAWEDCTDPPKSKCQDCSQTGTSGAASKARAPSDSRSASCPWRRPSNASGRQCGTAGAPGTTPVSCEVSANPRWTGTWGPSRNFEGASACSRDATGGACPRTSSATLLPRTWGRATSKSCSRGTTTREAGMDQKHSVARRLEPRPGGGERERAAGEGRSQGGGQHGSAAVHGGRRAHQGRVVNPGTGSNVLCTLPRGERSDHGPRRGQRAGVPGDQVPQRRAAAGDGTVDGKVGRIPGATQGKPWVPPRRPCVVPRDRRAAQGTAQHSGPARWILQVSTLALVPEVRGSPAPRPRARCGSSCCGGKVEVGDSGGDILQGAAAMAVRARGTHPPA